MRSVGLWVAVVVASSLPAAAQVPYLVKDINPVGGSDPFQLTVAGDRLFFEATGGEGREIWVTEGTATTTLPTNPGPGGFVMNGPLGLGRDILFTNYGPPLAGLWRAGGSPASTTFVYPLLMGPSTTIGSVALLVANSGLWRSDGTPAGTSQLVPLDTSNTIFPTAFVGALGDTRFLTASGFPPELWRSDGTPAGSVRVATLAAEAGAALGDELILVAEGGLWKADRTTLGVQQIPAAGPQFPIFPVAANGRVFFAAGTDATGLELWTTDGTAAGTALVKDILPGPQGGLSDIQPMAFSPFVVMGSSVYFVANDGVHGRELWRSDGTEQGTVLVGETIPGPESGIDYGTTHVPDSMVAAGGLLFFASRTVAEGLELWQSDGLTAPVLRADVAPGPSSSTPASLRTDGRLLYFTADGAAGNETCPRRSPSTTSP
jgi:ELWxxDGT repeat protein